MNIRRLCVFVCSLMAVYANFSFKLSIKKGQVNSDRAESNDGPLALAFLSLRFLSASQILFASNWEALLLMRQRHFVRS